MLFRIFTLLSIFVFLACASKSMKNTDRRPTADEMPLEIEFKKRLEAERNRAESKPREAPSLPAAETVPTNLVEQVLLPEIKNELAKVIHAKQIAQIETFDQLRNMFPQNFRESEWRSRTIEKMNFEEKALPGMTWNEKTVDFYFVNPRNKKEICSVRSIVADKSFIKWDAISMSNIVTVPYISTRIFKTTDDFMPSPKPKASATIRCISEPQQ